MGEIGGHRQVQSGVENFFRCFDGDTGRLHFISNRLLHLGVVRQSKVLHQVIAGVLFGVKGGDTFGNGLLVLARSVVQRLNGLAICAVQQRDMNRGIQMWISYQAGQIG